MNAPQILKYKDLNHKHQDFHGDQIHKLSLLFQGGNKLLESASLFLPQEPFESSVQYHYRLKSASYKNYLAQIINDYTSELFTKSFSVYSQQHTSKIYDSFFTRCYSDGSLSDFMESIFNQALLQGKTWFGLDFPKNNKFSSLAEEEASPEAIPYLYHIDPLSVINWKYQNNKLQFLVLKNEELIQNSPFSSENIKRITFKIWLQDHNQVSYFIYQAETKKDFKPSDPFKLIEQDSVDFDEIPVLCLDISNNLCIGQVIGHLCQDLFKKESALSFAMTRSLFAIPVYKQGPEISEPGGAISTLTENPHRGSQTVKDMKNKGFAVIGPQDDISFVEPSGKSFQINQDKIESLTKEIYRLVNNMTNSTPHKNYSSGFSKELDQRAKQLILETYGHIVKKCILKIFQLISNARQENISWEVEGLSNYQRPNKEIILQEAQSISSINIPSNTFNSLWLKKIAFSLSPDLSPDEKNQIENEINSNIQQFQPQNIKNYQQSSSKDDQQNQKQ